jgi:RNA polymerase sigma factor (TIGR02999 family)
VEWRSSRSGLSLPQLDAECAASTLAYNFPVGTDGDVTRLLREWKEGRAGAVEELLPLVYPDLRRIANGYLRRERADHTLQATELVHELYFRLCNQREANWKDRAHFFTFTAKIMRMILTDHARRSHREKRGGHLERLPLSDQLPWTDLGGPEYLDLDLALDELEGIDARKAHMVEFCHLLGCTTEESAEILQISVATAERDLKFARGWLYRRLRPEAESKQP